MTKHEKRGTLRYHDDSGSYLVDAKGNKSRVDPDRIDELSQWTWHKNNKGYFTTAIHNNGEKRQILIKLHHMVLGYPPEGLVCDHINNDQTDNRRCNLQFISPRHNCTKDKLNKGVNWNSKGKAWKAQIFTQRYNFMTLGYFDTKEEALAQRERALAIIETCTKEDLVNLRMQYGRKPHRKKDRSAA
jgi:hypothetical protein